MATKGNNKQKEKLIQDLNANVDKLEEALKSLKESIDTISNGDGEQPYWNGSNACNVIKNALTQWEVDTSLLGCVKECKGAIKK